MPSSRQAYVSWAVLNNYSNTLLSPANSSVSKSIASVGLKLFRNLDWIQQLFQPNIDVENVVPVHKMKAEVNAVVLPL